VWKICTDKRLKNIQKNFNIEDISCEHQPSWNIVPNQSVPAVIRHTESSISLFQWGSFHHGQRTLQCQQADYARAETVDRNQVLKMLSKKGGA